MELFSVLQTTDDRPSRETLRRAFRALSWLVDVDADTLARTGYGIVAENLPFDRATELGAVLALSGVPNQVVSQKQLPALGMVMQTRRVDCLDEKLVVYDPLGRPLAADWSNLKVAAAGVVAGSETKRIVTEKAVRRASGYGHRGARQQTRRDVRYKQEQVKIMQLELFLFLDGQPRRYRVRHDKCQYNYLRQRMVSPPENNFLSILGDIKTRAVSAMFNLGFDQLLDSSSPPATYPNTRAFEEEIKWLLWRQPRAGDPRSSRPGLT